MIGNVLINLTYANWIEVVGDFFSLFDRELQQQREINSIDSPSRTRLIGKFLDMENQRTSS